MNDTTVVLGVVHKELVPVGRHLIVERCSARQWAWRVVDRDGRWLASGCSHLSAEKALDSARQAVRRNFKGR